MLSFNVVKIYFSLGHATTTKFFFTQCIAGIVFYPLYVCAIAGFFVMKKENLFRLFILFILIIFSAVVMLSCDDYDSRFNIPVIPFIFFLAAPAFSFLQKKFMH